MEAKIENDSHFKNGRRIVKKCRAQKHVVVEFFEHLKILLKIFFAYFFFFQRLYRARRSTARNRRLEPIKLEFR
jgi:hypothetical protein